MSFIRDMLIRKWTCFCAVRKVTDNGLGILRSVGLMQYYFSAPHFANALLQGEANSNFL